MGDSVKIDVERLRRVLVAVQYERVRQEQIGLDKAAEGTRWTSCAAPDMDGGDDRRYIVLAEEVGEVARALLESEGEDALRAELIQVAAVAVAWCEAIDTRTEIRLAAEEREAVRAALHASYASGDDERPFGSCRDRQFESCYDEHHTPPIIVGEWWRAEVSP